MKPDYEGFLELIVKLYKMKEELEILQAEFVGVHLEGAIENIEEVISETVDKAWRYVKK